MQSLKLLYDKMKLKYYPVIDRVTDRHSGDNLQGKLDSASKVGGFNAGSTQYNAGLRRRSNEWWIN